MSKENSLNNSSLSSNIEESEDSVNSLLDSNKDNDNIINNNQLNNLSINNRHNYFRKKIQKRNVIQSNESFFVSYANLSREQFFMKGLDLFKNPKRDFNENQIVIEFLMQLNPFAQGIKEVKRENYRDIFSSLSFTLKYKYFEKDKIIYRFNNEIDNFYLVLKGRVDILVPNEEYLYLTENEYFIYLLKLRKYNEKELLIKTLNRNNGQYPMNEKTFDIWIKRAYLTIQHNNMKMNSKEELYGKRNSFMKKESIKRLNSKKSNSPIQTNKKIYQSKLSLKNNLKNIIPFESKEEIELVLEIQKEVIDAFQFINNEKEIKKISSEKYINRIKPIIKENKNELSEKFLVERKLVLIYNYFLAESLGQGEKFGEELTEKNIYNENKRVETIITSKDTDLAYFDIIQYNDILRDISEKARKDKMNFILGLSLFRNNDSFSNLKNFTNYFKQKIFKYKDILYTENNSYENKHFIYFIQSGEFETKAIKSLLEIDEILNCTSYKNKLTHFEGLESLKEYYIPRDLKLETFGENDMIGLSDCVYNNKYIFTVSCKTNHSIAYEINVNVFKMLLNISPIIKERLIQMQKIKNNVISSLLYNQRESVIEKIISKYKDKAKSNYNKRLKFSAKNFIKRITRPLSEKREINKGKVNKEYHNFSQNYFNNKITFGEKINEINVLYYRISNSKKKEKFDLDLIMRNETTTNSSKMHQSNLFNTFNNGFSSRTNIKNIKKRNINKRNIYENVFKKKILNDKTIELKNMTKNFSEIKFNNKYLNTIHNSNNNLNKNNLFINPLVYDDFNRNYNTIRYFKPTKNNFREKLYTLEISSAIKKRNNRLVTSIQSTNSNIKKKRKIILETK